MKGKTKPKAPDIELHPDAWERFEKAVDMVMRSPPKPRKSKAPKITRLQIGAGSDLAKPVVEALSSFRDALESVGQLPVGVVHQLIRFLDRGDSIIDVRLAKLKHVSATGTWETRIVLEPSEGLLVLLAAVRARDWDGLLARIDEH